MNLLHIFLPLTSPIKDFLWQAISSYQIPSASLRAVRVIYAAYLLTVKVPTALWTADMPSAFYLPVVGPMCLFSNYPHLWATTALNMALAFLATALLFGYGRAWLSFAVAATVIGLDCCAFTAGRIDGNSVLWFIPLSLAFSSWSDRSVPTQEPRKQQVNSDPLCLFTLAMLIGYAMFQAGLTKALTGWLDPHQLCTYGYWVTITHSRITGAAGNVLFSWASESAGPLFWKALDYVTVAWECAFLFAIFRMSWFRMMAWSATCFHAGVGAIFGIFFNWNLIGYLAFFDLGFRWKTFQAPLRLLFTLAGLAIAIGSVRSIDTRQNLWITYAPAWGHAAIIYTAPLFFGILFCRNTICARQGS
jgi:hypothetical protein